jgi:predicted phosphodiesterase
MTTLRLVLMADTHLPRRARRLPDELWRAVDEADVVVHAGDWVDVALLDELDARTPRLLGVVGNNDGPELRERLPVFGHSHIPWDTRAEGGLRLLNPGSPTDRRRQPHCTYLTATAYDGRLEAVTLHRLPPRTRA